MKKSGILNQELMSEMTGLGHLDCFVVCDAGFPIPGGAKKIDLALVKNLPTVMQTLKAILGEVIVEKIILCEEMRDKSKELLGEMEGIFVNQEKAYYEWPEFYEQAKAAKLFIRTGDFTPYANIILQSASGVREFNEKFDITL